MLEVEEIKIKVPSMSQEAARNLGEAVAQRLMAGLPDNTPSGALGSLNIKMNAENNISESVMAGQIATQILKELKFL